MVEWSCLEVEGKVSLSSLVLPEARPILTLVATTEEVPFFLALQLDGQTVGLAVLVKYPLEHTAQLYSLFVEKAFRSRGGGEYLCKEAIRRVQEQGITWVECEYGTEGTALLALEKLLEKTGWEKPSLYLERYRFCSADFSPPWLSCLQRPVEGLEIFLWQERTEMDERVARWMLEQGHVSSFLSPFDQIPYQEPLNSLGARQHGRLVGWMITHRSDAETIRYSSLFFDRHLATSGYGLFLLGEAIRLQQASQIPYGLCEVNLEKVEPGWARFVKKRLAPYAQSIEKRKWVSRRVHPA